jgi:hypothetical protein
MESVIYNNWGGTVHIFYTTVQKGWLGRGVENRVQVKAKFSLWLIKHQAMLTYGEVEVKLHAVIISALDEGEWPVSLLDCFALGKSRYPLDWGLCSNRLLREILGPKKEQQAGENCTVRRFVAQVTQMRSYYNILFGKHEMHVCGSPY